MLISIRKLLWNWFHPLELVYERLGNHKRITWFRTAKHQFSLVFYTLDAFETFWKLSGAALFIGRPSLSVVPGPVLKDLFIGFNRKLNYPSVTLTKRKEHLKGTLKELLKRSLKSNFKRNLNRNLKKSLKRNFKRNFKRNIKRNLKRNKKEH